MISWGSILYGGALSALVAVAVVALTSRPRRPDLLLGTALAAAGGPIAWNAILRAVDGGEFFVDAPTAFFPVSWQDTGSGVFALAAACLVLGLGPQRGLRGIDVARAGLLIGLAALVVDVYLY